MADLGESPAQLTIGAVARATGIPVETLRTWERRYGFPEPLRTPSGHRVYALDCIERLRLVSEAIAQGHRASNVVPQPVAALRALLGFEQQTLVSTPRQPEVEVAREWLGHVRALRGDALDAVFRNELALRGAIGFLEDRVGPFLHVVGEAWARGQIDIYHEHFASERIRDFLVTTWRPLADASRGPQVLLSTLPGERHGIGLQMAAVALATAGCRIAFLGTDTPIADIQGAARQLGSSAVVVSVARSADLDRTVEQLRLLRSRLPPDVALIVGGTGAPAAVDGATVIVELSALHAWAHRLVRRSQAE